MTRPAGRKIQSRTPVQTTAATTTAETAGGARAIRRRRASCGGARCSRPRRTLSSPSSTASTTPACAWSSAYTPTDASPLTMRQGTAAAMRRRTVCHAASSTRTTRIRSRRQIRAGTAAGLQGLRSRGAAPSLARAWTATASSTARPCTAAIPRAPVRRSRTAMLPTMP